MAKRMTDHRKLSPGTYADLTMRNGYVYYVPVSEEEIAHRHALADALGFVLRNPCSAHSSGMFGACEGETCKVPHFPCYESKALMSDGVANSHLVHHTRLPSVPDGVRILLWPDEVNAAFAAAKKVKR